jgi:hypothetical protein
MTAISPSRRRSTLGLILPILTSRPADVFESKPIRAADEGLASAISEPQARIDIRRPLAEIFAAARLRRRPQRGTGLVNFGEVFVDLCVGSRQGFLRPIVRLTALGPGSRAAALPD